METRPRPTTLTISKTPSIQQLGWPVGESFTIQSCGIAGTSGNCRAGQSRASRAPAFDDFSSCHTPLAATNKCLAQNNKSRTGGPATNKRTGSAAHSSGAANRRGPRCGGSALLVFHCPLTTSRSIPRLGWPVGESCTIQSWRRDLAFGLVPSRPKPSE